MPVRLDFIGNAALTSGNRTASAGDTLTTRAYVEGTDNSLTHLRITVTYEPTRTPFLYPVPATKDVPNDPALTYLDSTLAVTSPPSPTFSGQELLFSNRFSARTTSGTELWQYTATDAKGATANRALRVTVRKPDSLAVFHGYTAIMRPVPPATVAGTATALGLRDQARAFINLRTGLVLAKYSLLNSQNTLQGNQPFVDLICEATASSVSLSAPAAASLTTSLNASRWPPANRRRTVIRRTALTPTNFNEARTTASFRTAFAGGTLLASDTLSTGPLTENAVLAFRTAEGLNGLILVADVVTGSLPILNCTIKVEKRPLP